MGTLSLHSTDSFLCNNAHQLKYPNSYIANIGQLDLDALPRIARHISALLASADFRENTVDAVAEYLCA
jgi:hypothetical protein